MEQRPDLKKLSGAQLVVVLEAAGQLHQHRRESFLAAVALSLVGCPDHGDGAVHRAIRSCTQRSTCCAQGCVVAGS
jgi:hypothetical protein